MLWSAFGKVDYRQRYYLCPTCHQGHSLLDLKYGIVPGQTMPTLASLLGMLGMEISFEEGRRERWKVENENNNVLKTKGYHIEQNFGHGNQHLVSLLLSLNLLVFLFHTILDLVNEQYRAIWQALGRRKTFFQDLGALLRLFIFENWDAVFSFMIEGLELDTG